MHTTGRVAPDGPRMIVIGHSFVGLLFSFLMNGLLFLQCLIELLLQRDETKLLQEAERIVVAAIADDLAIADAIHITKA